MTESPFEETPPQQKPDGRPVREPVFNAPWQAVAVTILIVGGYAIQRQFPVDAIENAYAFAPANLVPGRWETVITAIFLHGGWAHAMMNGAFALAFSTPLARLFGPKLEGGLLFFSFYLLTGVLANLGFAAVHPGSPALIVGASGAVSGLMGASARLIGGGGRPGPMFSKPVISMGAAWLIINAIIALVGGSFLPGAGSAGVAWEAHLVGFAAGVLLIGPFARLAPHGEGPQPSP
ncbi:MAG: rhomboid family protein [Phenylobacterium sp.]|jgi:membrane associated rhomboid family serine protease|uniref:rhomboid family intramembrane serine protease n=1 Tax=Phenylobacterium sp. TaxID=1871053 RepID=UPI00260D47FD|nr:rhomboid family intramembrane serine protease [Phenylobacterium sp.]MDB5464294.1 rhomboid family protein [Phenylobacterium sp.]MDB5499770.1 rhomboid family protein [Phenylobacterium sp.]